MFATPADAPGTYSWTAGMKYCADLDAYGHKKPALLPLPVEPFRYYQYGERTVHLDGCVEVEAAYYGAPPGWIGRHVQVQWDASHVRLLDPLTGNLLREHLRQ
jgi:hypothetical protein